MKCESSSRQCMRKAGECDRHGACDVRVRQVFQEGRTDCLGDWAAHMTGMAKAMKPQRPADPRAAFEKAMQPFGLTDMWLEKDDAGNYTFSRTGDAWLGWQECWKALT